MLCFTAMSAPIVVDRAALLIQALRATAQRLEQGAPHQWGHWGQCNCGHLAQTVTGKSAAEIHESAMRRHAAATTEWSEHAHDYCPGSGALVDDMVDALLTIGLTRQDIGHLEYLDDPRILRHLGTDALVRSSREDAVRYLRAWAELIEA